MSNKPATILFPLLAVVAATLAGAQTKEAKPIRTSPAVVRDLAAGLVARWKFDDGKGAVVADSTGSFPGALKNGSEKSWRKSATGETCLLFDGKTRVEVPDFPFMPIGRGNGLTIAAWVKPKEGFVVSKNSDISSSASFEFAVGFEQGRLSLICKGSSNALSNLRLDDGAWRHFALVLDDNIGTWFVDGMADSSFKVAGPNHEQKLPLLIGARRTKKSGRLGGFYKGEMRDLAIYNRVLAPEELYALAKPVRRRVSSAEKESAGKE